VLELKHVFKGHNTRVCRNTRVNLHMGRNTRVTTKHMFKTRNTRIKPRNTRVKD